MTDANRFYAACLASYNSGVLHGAWIEASTDKDEMQQQINAMLRASKFPNVTVEHEGKRVPSAEEWAIHDHEGPWLHDIGEYAGLGEIARRMMIAEAMDNVGIDDDDAPELFSAYVDHYGAQYIRDDEPSDIADAIRDAYQGSAKSREEWAAQYAEDVGLLNEVPESLRYYFDFDAWARDMEMNGEVDFVTGGEGVLVFMWGR